ncbi:sensor histidine kinase [Tessaracoccus caeni]|uniref:sensor histidine kinase n=1 Tax=Tessaracoccus caeni TaxID=3031239 RepID=UPI0023D9D74C|nr:ATP-binding protein [Tessaracoccus caeni]MDF1489327.1 ATP-binding protein [Tessaracoccus caeni]
MPPVVAALVGAGIVAALWVLVHVVRVGLQHRRELESREDRPPVPVELAEALDALPVGAALVGSHDELLHHNQHAEPMNLVRGTRVGFPELLDVVHQVQATGEPYSGPLVRPARPGQERVDLKGQVQPLTGGLILLVAIDESAHKRIEAVGRDFLANISHELKTPIGAIEVLAEAVEMAKDDPDDVAHFAARLTAETQRLADLVGQIIELSRLQSSDPVLARDEVDLIEVVQEAVSRTHPRAVKRGIAIATSLAPVTVTGDRWQLVDAVTNLINNAISYSDAPGRVAVSISEVADNGDKWAEVRVADSGIGIAAEDLERIFERFYRVDDARSRATGGTGLGLSIVRQIAAVHGGTVTVWSRPGDGSTFTIRIPLCLAPTSEEYLI